MSKELDREIEQKKQKLNEIKLRHKEEKDQAQKELDSITKAITTAQEIFARQKDELKSQLNEYMAQNRLSWDRVNTACSLLDSELSNTELSQENITQVRKKIVSAGSLAVFARQIESEVKQLAKEKGTLATSISKLTNLNSSLQVSILNKRKEEGRLEAQLQVKSAKLAEVEEMISRYTEDISAARIVIQFLASPKSFTSHDFNQLFRLFVSLRQHRLIIEYQTKTLRSDVICEHHVVPGLRTYIEEAKKKLALYLMPIVKDKLLSIFKEKMTHTTKSILELNGRL